MKQGNTRIINVATQKRFVIRGSQKMLLELLFMLFFVDDQLNSKHPERSWAFSLQQSWGPVSEDIFSFNIFQLHCHYIKKHFTKSNYTGARWADTPPSSLRSYATHSKPATEALSSSSDRSSHPLLLGFTFPRCPLGSSCTSLWAL